MSKECKIIEDLLPLYHDGVCSKESRQMVEEHLLQCEDCQKRLSQIDGEIVSPADEADVKVLKDISKKVRIGRKRALIVGASIALAAVLLLFAVISGWWYCYEYTYYTAFAKVDKTAAHTYESTEAGSLKPENRYVWQDDTYEYEVVIPDFLSTGGFVGMSRLGNDESSVVELAITRWEKEKYIFHVFVTGADETYYFIIDSDLNLYGNYTEEEMNTKREELSRYKEEVQNIIDGAITMWSFAH
jgi:hypothetical protein